MCSDVVIDVRHLAKCYAIYDAPRDRLKQFILPRMQRFIGRVPRQYFREFWALKELSFTVKKGETVGIIGRNGSGKSTLLQIICGTLAPSDGTVTIHGRVAALLELGSGFNPEFTGRENVYLNGAVLGLPKDEIDARFDAIAAFADIGDFLEQPVKTYSSGMTVRLAFAVIAHVDADVLVIDEALAVGDALFQQRCQRFLRAFQRKGGTILFVSHDTGAVLNLCKKALLLGQGNVVQWGAADAVCRHYLEQLYAEPGRGEDNSRDSAFGPYAVAEEGLSAANEEGWRSYTGDAGPDTVYNISAFRPHAERFGDGGATIVDAGFLDERGNIATIVRGDQHVRFFIRVTTQRRVACPAFGFMIKNHLGEYVFTEGTDAHFRRHELALEAGDTVTATFAFTMPHLIRGQYLINVAFADGRGDNHIQLCWLHDAIRIDVIGGRLVHGYCGMNNVAMSIDVHC